MTPEQQRIKIAEVCGFEDIKCRPGLSTIWKRSILSGVNKRTRRLAPIPDYLKNLNAMHEAEGVLDEDQRVTFLELLSGSLWDVCHATAAQRAEAFLKTLGLWTDE